MMTLSSADIEKIARLASLDTASEQTSKLNEEVNSIMNFVDQLRSVDTANVAPLFHPLARHQRLRADEVSEEECIAELEAMAPLFEEDLYLVPKVIESEK
jgi:aspartyl-tRNA(Asn)/glutamyl-tRNA(Gln) amidotransferase subunit C